LVIVRLEGPAGVQVEEHGEGVATEDRDQIFDPFWRESVCIPGAGLGLAIAKDLMNEDQDRSRLGNASQRLAVLRHMALNVMQKGGVKGALRGKIKRAGCENAYLARLLLLFRGAIALRHEGCGNALIWVNWAGTVQWLLNSSSDADARSFTFIRRGRYAASPV
jgi:hypothetical protein